MLVLILCIVVVILAIKNSNLNSDNKMLNERLSKVFNYCPKCGTRLNNEQTSYFQPNNNYNPSPVMYNQNASVNANQNVLNTSIKKEKHFDEREIKNSLILYLGAFLIVLAAIVFLASTWDISHSFLKTGILMLLLLVFFSGSVIADKVLKIKNTAKIFLYIGLSYVPIVLFSLIFFELLGSNFIYGSIGSYIYLSFSSILTSIIYYIMANKNKSLFLTIGMSVFHIIAIIFGVLVFTNNYNIITNFIILYFLVITLLYTFNKTIYSDNYHKNLVTTFSVITIPLLMIGTFDITISFIISLVILLINYYFWLNKIINQKEIYNYVYPFITLLIATLLPKTLNMVNMLDGIQFFVLIAACLLLLFDNIFKKKLDMSTYIISSVAIIVIYILSLVRVDSFINSYFIMFLYTIFSLVRYIGNKEKTISHYIFNIALATTIMDVLAYYNVNVYIITLVYLPMIIAAILLKKKDQNFALATNIIGNISIGLSYFVSLFVNNISDTKIIILSIILFIFYFLYYLITKKHFYKWASFVLLTTLNLGLLNRFILDHNNLLFVVPTITYIILQLFNKDDNKIIVTVSYVLTMFTLTFNMDLVAMIIMLITSMIYSYYIYNYKYHKNYYIAPLLLSIPFVYNYDKFIYLDFNILSIISLIIIIGLLIKSYRNSKYTLFDIVLPVHILTFIGSFSDNKYIVLALLISLALVFYLSKEKAKKLWQSSLYVLATILFEVILTDLALDSITALRVGIINITILLITRTVIKRDNRNCKPLEYIFTIIINFIALFSYNSVYDGMGYVAFLVLLLIASYYLKYGPTFLCSIGFILINVFMLTRDFWFAIPWWIYLLGLGVILVTFSIRNEMNKDKEKKDIQKLKEKLDL